MRSIFTIILITLTISCAGMYRQRTIRNLPRTTAKIQVIGPNGIPWSTGTAFAVSKDLLVTANHVCAHYTVGSKIVVSSAKYSEYTLVPIYMNTTTDTCVLFGNPGLKPMRIASPSKFGDRLYAAGHPIGRPLTITDGYAGPYLNTALGLFRQISTPVFGGNSGGPVFNDWGSVVCFIVAGVPAYPHVSYCSEDFDYVRKQLSNAGHQ